jgi:hypothetical protein
MNIKDECEISMLFDMFRNGNHIVYTEIILCDIYNDI